MSDVVQIEERKPPRHKLKGKSRVTNGKSFLPHVDGRSLIARRYRDIASQIMVDQGDAALVSEARAQLVRRFSAAACLAEQLEARLANGETIDIAEHALLCSTLVRLAGKIGINRIPKDIEASSLDEYLAEKATVDE